MAPDFLLGEPGPRIPVVVGWISPVIAAGTAILIQNGHEAVLPVTPYAAGQLLVEQVMLYVLVPAVGRRNLPEIAAAWRHGDLGRLSGPNVSAGREGAGEGT